MYYFFVDVNIIISADRSMKRPEKGIFPNVKESLTNHLGLAGVPVYRHIPQIHTNMYVYIHLTRKFEYMYMYIHICIFKDLYHILPVYLDIYIGHTSMLSLLRE
jgi:hypothetical protein